MECGNKRVTKSVARILLESYDEWVKSECSKYTIEVVLFCLNRACCEIEGQTTTLVSIPALKKQISSANQVYLHSLPQLPAEDLLYA